jgi:hypothetical protein
VGAGAGGRGAAEECGQRRCPRRRERFVPNLLFGNLQELEGVVLDAWRMAALSVFAGGNQCPISNGPPMLAVAPAALTPSLHIDIVPICSCVVPEHATRSGWRCTSQDPRPGSWNEEALTPTRRCVSSVNLRSRFLSRRYQPDRAAAAPIERNSSQPNCKKLTARTHYTSISSTVTIDPRCRSDASCHSRARRSGT